MMKVLARLVLKALDPLEFVKAPRLRGQVVFNGGTVVYETASVSGAEGSGTQRYVRTASMRPVLGSDGGVDVSVTCVKEREADQWFLKVFDHNQPFVERKLQADDAIREYKRLFKELAYGRQGSKVGRGRIIGIGVTMAVVALGLYAALFVIGSVVQAATPAMSAAPETSQMAGAAPAYAAPAQVAAKAQPSSNMISADERAMIARRGSPILLGKGGPQLIVFSDPNCPFCQELEPALHEVAAYAQPIVIPVAFKSTSKELVASALCAADPVAAWKRVIQSGQMAGKACAEGLKKVEENNRLFADLSLTATPTLISPGGRLAASSATAAQLKEFLKI